MGAGASSDLRPVRLPVRRNWTAEAAGVQRRYTHLPAEASVIQWHWLQDVAPNLDQFNSIHEKLIAKWQDIGPALLGSTLYFTYSAAAGTEDLMTTEYLRDTALQAGLTTAALPIEQVGWDATRHCFVDVDDQPI